MAHIPKLPVQLAAREALLLLELPVEAAADRPGAGPWRPRRRLGPWIAGRRAPWVPPAPGSRSPGLGRDTHVLLPIGAELPGEVALIKAVRRACLLPTTVPDRPPAACRVPGARSPAVALIRPDQEVAGIFQPASG